VGEGICRWITLPGRGCRSGRLASVSAQQACLWTKPRGRVSGLKRRKWWERGSADGLPCRGAGRCRGGQPRVTRRRRKSSLVSPHKSPVDAAERLASPETSRRRQRMVMNLTSRPEVEFDGSLSLQAGPGAVHERARAHKVAGDVTPATKDGDEPHLAAGGRVRRL
jgi:hypothetical protein